ncbi:metallo-beta-lactamase class B [Silvibacterium bohemicum]|uniref:Metallo-beta-lactamase class B n=1 Tax=Silvibacterium bohemicum TaxID=1577686 RepID=A0A841JYP6_9BACT|nr:subclass B3 metallo-beta-lactamase [Silvibacterium bohemicum]MBB6145755.1 metallo-beta-lactamase class B [Silvibacterium bohemicum]
MLKRLLLLILLSTESFHALHAVNPEWTEPFPPHRIAGNLYYVGSKDLASFLITTPQGHILINSNLATSPLQIRKSVEQLGFRFTDIKILLISHAHFDHCAGSALIKQFTHAQYMVMDADVPTVESGGRKDFAFGNSPKMFYPRAKVDRVLHDGSQVRLGGVVLTAHLTAGHTRGCTTWTLQVPDHGKLYNVVIVGSPNVLSEYKLVNNQAYPQIAQDFTKQFQTLRGLPCNIFLGAHGGYYNLVEKYARLKNGQPNPFIDPDGYKAFVADAQQAFEEALQKQQRNR